jgi:hypothetical protein
MTDFRPRLLASFAYNRKGKKVWVREYTYDSLAQARAAARTLTTHDDVQRVTVWVDETHRTVWLPSSGWRPVEESGDLLARFARDHMESRRLRGSYDQSVIDRFNEYKREHPTWTPSR